MKKQLKVIVLVLYLGIFLNVHDAGAGFLGPELKSVTTVKEVLQNHYDDMRVTLKGRITKRLSHDKYLFEDGTGEIVVDIDGKYMPYDNITAETLIQINGEVDVEYRGGRGGVEIEVYRVEVIK